MNNERCAIIIVIDSLGCGALPDASDYGDELTCNTLCNIAKATGGLSLPSLEKLGLGNILPIEGVKPSEKPLASYGIAKMKSKGKDTTTGHWEIAGLVLDEPFKTYEKFPPSLIEEFIEKTNCGGILGNYAASGTKIIEDLNEQHQKTRFPIVYTSADSVFQIAADVDLVGVETLYEWCKTARKILGDTTSGWGISRVIARPYHLVDGEPERIGALRHDYSLSPHKPTLLNEIETAGGKTYAIGKINDIFVGSGVSEFVTTASNKDGLEKTLEAIKKSHANLIFTNLVDTDMLFGHRRDPIGYKNALVEIDAYLEKILAQLGDEYLLIITADHGCDPTHKGTDHTREQVPLLIYNKLLPAKNLGTSETFAVIAREVKNWLGISA